MPSLVFRVDAGARMGSGHLMRCLALAQAWEPPCGFLMSAVDPRVAAAGMRPLTLAATPGTAADARETAALARSLDAEWVVVDGYHFDTDYQRTLRAAGLHVLCIDDNGEAGEYAADIIVNQNLHADAGLYAGRADRSELLLGAEYVMLRPEFASAAPDRRPVAPTARRVLVTLGGGTNERVLATILEALANAGIDGLEATVLTGAARSDAVNAAAARVPGRVHLLDSSGDMRQLMEGADLAISAGGSTTWELAFMGVPSALIIVAPNQAAAAGASVERGIAILLGEIERLQMREVAAAIGELARNAERRRVMSDTGPKLIDGRGATRVAARMRALSLAGAGAARSRTTG